MPATKNFPVFDCDSYVVEPPMKVTERVEEYQPTILPW
jgi:hypothetical protein